ncbi:MAG: nuclear transport factor 2 family protein [Ginsengibacter sp.]
MRRLFILFFTQAVLLSSCEQNKTDDPEELTKVLVGYFDGFVAKDFQRMKDLTTADFVLYEDGEVLNNENMFNIRNGISKLTGKYKFDNLNITIDTKSGSMNYTNHGDLIFNDTTVMKIEWLESATFKKVDGKWKMNFLQSSPKK